MDWQTVLYGAIWGCFGIRFFIKNPVFTTLVSVANRNDFVTIMSEVTLIPISKLAGHFHCNGHFVVYRLLPANMFVAIIVVAVTIISTTTVLHVDQPCGVEEQAAGQTP